MLDLLITHPEPHMTVQALARAGEIMGLSTPSVRVALTRLLGQDRIVKTGRGCYAVQLQGNSVHYEVQHWFEKESRMGHWSGGWLLVHDGGVSRSDKTAWRHHLRALDLNGFRALATGLSVRPDNLDGGAEAMRAALARLGLAPGSLVFSGGDFDADAAARMRALWDVQALSAAYRDALKLIEHSNARLARMTPEAAARETLLVGRAVIRGIVRDPLLPEAIQPGAPRRALIDATRTYQARARALWQDVLAG
ncbi:PaaX family transcriptional regulator [Variovorax sp. M-6]|uniref:PaaX family transcriptional regulator n=1 Tax=Variovorax sp. M-6 TaxID=3233041 RepID=UPI003F98D770